MKIIVFGANGRTGQELIKQAVNKGMEVTAFVRNAESIKLQSEKLNIVVGQATNYEDVKKAIAGHDAVVSCIGGAGIKVSTIITDITTNEIITDKCFINYNCSHLRSSISYFRVFNG